VRDGRETQARFFAVFSHAFNRVQGLTTPRFVVVLVDTFSNRMRSNK
jgi:hypothetical protein